MPADGAKKGGIKMSVYKVMEGQAGQRLIVSCKYEKSCSVCTSHYVNMEEFFAFKPKENPFNGKMEWYQVKGQEKVYLGEEL